jgi:TonB family protein
MFTVAQPTFRTMATSFAASALLTTLAIAGSASPAHAAENAGFVRNVQTQLNTGKFSPSTNQGVSTIAVRIDADGKVLSADVARSSGHSELDRDALVTAKSVSYPKGNANRLVAVVMKYGKVSAPAAKESASLVSRYVNAKGEALATQTPAPNAG